MSEVRAQTLGGITCHSKLLGLFLCLCFDEQWDSIRNYWQWSELWFRKNFPLVSWVKRGCITEWLKKMKPDHLYLVLSLPLRSGWSGTDYLTFVCLSFSMGREGIIRTSASLSCCEGEYANKLKVHGTAADFQWTLAFVNTALKQHFICT